MGAALQRYRQNVGYTLDDAARILDCDRSKISRIESGQRGIRADELLRLLAEYGVPATRQNVLASIAWKRGELGDYAAYSDVLPVPLIDYLIIEAAASTITTYQAQQVPPLLQTEDYARAVAMASPDVPGEWVDMIIESVLVRQRLTLTTQETPVDALISEAALRQQVGGAAVMRAQLARLEHGAVNDPRVTIRVIPFRTQAHAGIGLGSPTLARFDETPELDVVHLAGLAGGTLLADPPTVRAYAGALSRIRAATLSPPESARLIRTLSRG